MNTSMLSSVEMPQSWKLKLLRRAARIFILDTSPHLLDSVQTGFQERFDLEIERPVEVLRT